MSWHAYVDKNGLRHLSVLALNRCCLLFEIIHYVHTHSKMCTPSEHVCLDKDLKSSPVIAHSFSCNHLWLDIPAPAIDLLWVDVSFNLSLELSFNLWRKSTRLKNLRRANWYAPCEFNLVSQIKILTNRFVNLSNKMRQCFNDFHALDRNLDIFSMM